MSYSVESLPPEYNPGTNPYLDSIRQKHSISPEDKGQDVRDKVHALWRTSLGRADGVNNRIQLMEILMGDRVEGQEIGSLGYVYLHIQQPESFESFIGGVAAAKGWLEEDRAAQQSN